MSQEVPGPPRRYSPPKGYPTLKFSKSSGPRKYTTSKFSTQIPQISVGGRGRGVHTRHICSLFKKKWPCGYGAELPSHWLQIQKYLMVSWLTQPCILPRWIK